MTDKPIPFSAPMIRALLDGRKTQTRRILKNESSRLMCRTCGASEREYKAALCGCRPGNLQWTPCENAKYRVGDRLYVRETYYQRGHWEPVQGRQTKGGRQKWAFTPADDVILFDVPHVEGVRLGRHHKDPSTVAWHKRLARFMPKSASRLTLIVTDVRVERLQDISEADAIAEGVTEGVTTFDYDALDGSTFTKEAAWFSVRGLDDPGCGTSAVDMYSVLWNVINGPGAWDANQWVAAYSFRVIKANIDSEEARNG